MELNFYVDDTTIGDITCGEFDIYKAFKIGECVEIEPVICTKIDDIKILKDAKISTKSLDDEGKYEIVAKICGGYADVLDIPDKTFKKPKSAKKKDICWDRVYLAVDFGIMSRAIIDIPILCWVYRKEEYVTSYIPIVESLTKEITFKKGDYIKIIGTLCPVFLDFWESAIVVRCCKGIIKNIKELPNGGVLRVKIIDRNGKLETTSKSFRFNDFSYDDYYAKYAPKIDENNNDSLTIRYSDLTYNKEG